MGRREPQRVPVEVQAAEFTQPGVSTLGRSWESAEAAATWGDEVKW